MKTASLLCLCFLAFSFSYSLAASCTEEDVYECLWEKSKDIAKMTLETDFLMQMNNGSLRAERYIGFTIQDINYVVKVTKMLKKLSVKVIQPDDLRDFVQNRYTSYKGFADLMVKQYLFKVEPRIQQTPAMKKYLSFYKNLLEKEDPLYFAVGLLPCARLWVWLANNINIPPTNAYYTWKEQNMGGHPEKHYKVLLNKYLDTPDKVAKATTIFRTQMQHEHDFFLSS